MNKTSAPFLYCAVFYLRRFCLAPFMFCAVLACAVYTAPFMLRRFCLRRFFRLPPIPHSSQKIIEPSTSKLKKENEICPLLKSLVKVLNDPLPSEKHALEADELAIKINNCKDSRFGLKVRLSGALTSLSRNVFNPNNLMFCTQNLLKLTSTSCMRSVRNCHLISKDKHFAERFVGLIRRISDTEGGYIGGDLLLLSTSINSDAWIAILFEILFYITKPKKCKAKFFQNGIVELTRNIFMQHFEKRNRDRIHLEVALITIALLRRFSLSKIGRSNLIDYSIPVLCESCIEKLEYEMKNNKHQPDLCRQLQNSLCALYLRCLPQWQLPVATSNLPLSLKIHNPRLQDFSEGEDGSESDEDEEQESFFPYISATTQNKADDYIAEDDQEGDARPIKYNKQTSRKLVLNYEHCFSELKPYETNSNLIQPYELSSLPGTSKLTKMVPSEFLPEGSKNYHFKSVLYKRISSTKSIIKFVKIAYPELVNSTFVQRQLLFSTDEPMLEVMRRKIVNRIKTPFKRNVVCDLDALLSQCPGDGLQSPSRNDDLQRIGKKLDSTHLHFEGRFESGNLRKAIQISEHTYEIVLSPDFSHERNLHFQWFYFEVSNTRAGVLYTFEIINFVKNSSCFTKGMQPVLFSVTEAVKNTPCWIRIGEAVCYYRNLYVVNEAKNTKEFKEAKIVQNQSNDKHKKRKKGEEIKNFFTLSFMLKFQHNFDVCYIAYHFPYTYSYLEATLEWRIARCSANDKQIYARRDILCYTILKNPVSLITITSMGDAKEIKQRELVFITSRVHPGESNSSWIMQGVLDFLLSNSFSAITARQLFVFKIIPMLNPDGVINGSHRISLSGNDLNRVWNDPSERLNPTIFHAKGIVQYMVDLVRKKPFVFVDIHGHSKKNNIFMYGNDPKQDHANQQKICRHEEDFLALPKILGEMYDSFSVKTSRFSVTKSKESSARVALWRQFGLERAYTLESTYCGFDSGTNSGTQITINDLKRMGATLAEGIIRLKKGNDKNSLKREPSKSLMEKNVYRLSQKKKISKPIF